MNGKIDPPKKSKDFITHIARSSDIMGSMQCQVVLNVSQAVGDEGWPR